jgi:type II secretory pathway predicted ATPase ExeA
MYENHYGFRAKPFSLIPDPDFFFTSKAHNMALTLLEYSLTEQTGFIVISGEVGSGKTMLIRRLLENIPEDITVGLITNTHRSFGELLQYVLLAFDLDYKDNQKVELYRRFVDFLIGQYSNGKRTVLIIDEAQNLAADALEEIRLLSNVNSGKDFLLQLILIGQPELLDVLKRPELRQFVQRISVDYQLRPLDVAETRAYIGHRISVVGGRHDLFDTGACAAIYYFTGGIPRLINVLCDLALVFGFAEGDARIDIDTVMDVAAARALTGLAAFRAEPDGSSRAEVRARILEMAAGTQEPRRVAGL